MNADNNGGRNFDQFSSGELREGNIRSVRIHITEQGVIFPGLAEMGLGPYGSFVSQSGRADIPPIFGSVGIGNGDDGIQTAIDILSEDPAYTDIHRNLPRQMTEELMKEDYSLAHSFIPGTNQTALVSVQRFEEAGKTWYVMRAPSSPTAERTIAQRLDRQRAIQNTTVEIIFSHLGGRFMLDMDAIANAIRGAVGAAAKTMSGQELADYIMSRNPSGQPVDTELFPALLGRTADGTAILLHLGQLGPHIDRQAYRERRDSSELWEREGNVLYGNLAATESGREIPPHITIELRDPRNNRPFNDDIHPMVSSERRIQALQLTRAIEAAFQKFR